MPLPVLAALGIKAGAGALVGLLKGGKSKAQKAQEREYLYWLQRQKDQEAQATSDAASTRQPAMAAYNDIYDNPGYNEGEQAGILSPELEAGMYFTPEEEEAMRLSPQYRDQMRARAVEPITGAGEAATRNLVNASAARGNYGGGYGANINRVFADQGRLSSEAVRDTNLGLSDIDRRTAQYLAEHRTGTTGDIADRRYRGWSDIGKTRLRGREVGAGGRLDIAQMDQNRMMGFSPNLVGRDAPQNTPNTWRNVAAGAIEGGISNLPSWGGQPNTAFGPRGSGAEFETQNPWLDQLQSTGSLIRPKRENSNLLY